MEWTERSFLLDIKPNASFANLFVNCPEGDQRDVIRIVKDGIELVPNHSGAECGDVLEHLIEPRQDPVEEPNRSLKATVDGLLLCPDTVTNYAWADDHQTFTCKLKVERWEECYFSPKSLKATLKILTTDVSIDQYCQKLDGQEISIGCHQCSKSLLKDGVKVTRCFQLPSTNYGESVDDWFCCTYHPTEPAEGGDNGNSASSCSCGPGASSSSRLKAPTADQCFIGDSTFLLNGSVVENISILSETGGRRGDVLVCSNCQSQLGNVEMFRGVFLPDTSKRDTVRFYHSAIDLQGKIGENPLFFLTTRYRTRERYFAWLLLSECEQQSSLKFAIKTLDNHPALLVWLLDSYSIMANGHLSDDWSLAPYKPFPILKMLYKKLDDNDMTDPRVTGEDGSVGRIWLPRQACEELTNCVVRSTGSLPPACRAVGQFSVGFIRMASSM